MELDVRAICTFIHIHWLGFVQDELTRLRQYLTDQPAPSGASPVTLPPPLLKLLLPSIRDASQATEAASSTVVNALTQRVKALQEENEELYQILKVKETGKLKEEVRGLRRVVHRLEGSLRGAFQYHQRPELFAKLYMQSRTKSLTSSRTSTILNSLAHHMSDPSLHCV